MPEDLDFPAVIRLCVLPGGADFVFNALSCSATQLFTDCFFFLFLPFKFVLKWSCASECVGCFLLKMSSLPEKGLTRSSETWLLSDMLINKYQSGTLILFLVALCIPFFPQCGTEQTPWGLERKQSAAISAPYLSEQD